MSVLILASLGVILDRFLGEPKRWHPIVAFGNLANHTERVLNQNTAEASTLRLRGLLALILVIAPIVLMSMWFTSLENFGVMFELVCLYLAIGARSLHEHAQRIYLALTNDDLTKARYELNMIVSRDTSELTEENISKATIESVLENGNDAIFAALFWFVIAGAPGVVLYRLVNTLDAMWGYKNSRFLNFGWAAARFDDVLNFIPARLTAFSYALLGHYQNAIHCWRTQGADWKSPNAGPVMAAGAGSLYVQLGGEASYHGTKQKRPILGKGNEPDINDIQRSLILVHRTTWLWLFIFITIWGVGEIA